MHLVQGPKRRKGNTLKEKITGANPFLTLIMALILEDKYDGDVDQDDDDDDEAVVDDDDN